MRFIIVLLIASFTTVCFALESGWVLGDSLSTDCYSNRDCSAQKGRCFDSVCTCLSTHIIVNGTCMPKIKPGGSTCHYDEQCQAVWPKTRCINTMCQCASGVHVKTRDGVVCIDYAKCPVGGAESILRASDGSMADCHISATGYMSGCLGQLHMYDCVKDKVQDQFYCCPNRANACHQPVNYGHEPQVLPPYPDDEFFTDGWFRNRRWKRNATGKAKYVPWYLRTREISVPSTVPEIPPQISHRLPKPRNPLFPVAVPNLESQRWYYDTNFEECLPFIFKGEGGNANNFETKQHCQNYCRTGCNRGNAMFQKDEDGLVEQFAQRQQMCIPNIGCGDPHYDCNVVQPGKALCCPTKEFVCSSFGGVPQREMQQPFDQGISCGNVTTIGTLRYYFDSVSLSCKPFSYRGCAGHFNNFLTVEECERFCGSNTVVHSKNGTVTVSHRQPANRNPKSSRYNVIWPLKPGSTFG